MGELYQAVMDDLVLHVSLELIVVKPIKEVLLSGLEADAVGGLKMGT